MGQIAGPALSLLLSSNRQYTLPASNAPAVGCALLDFGAHGSLANTRLLDWSARPVLISPAVAGAASTDYLAYDGTWKTIPPAVTPAGSGTELQYRNGASFAAVPNSSVDNYDVFLGGKLKTKQRSGSYQDGIRAESPNDDSFIGVRWDLSDTFVIESTWMASGAYKPIAIRTGGLNRLVIGTDGNATFGGIVHAPSVEADVGTDKPLRSYRGATYSGWYNGASLYGSESWYMGAGSHFFAIGATNYLHVSSIGISTPTHITSAFQTLSTDPTTFDLTSGLSRLVKNSTSGTLKLWSNDGGIMKSTALT